MTMHTALLSVYPHLRRPGNGCQSLGNSGKPGISRNFFSAGRKPEMPENFPEVRERSAIGWLSFLSIRYDNRFVSSICLAFTKFCIFKLGNGAGKDREVASLCGKDEYK